MKIEIEVVSTEIIKPSSPTPNELSNYKLSFLDQMNPLALMPGFYLYKTTDISNSKISTNLKTSLSKTLSVYYPLAGRIVENSYVNCNDEGIMYIEAQANSCKLIDVIDEPGTKEMDKLLPQNLAVDATHLCCIVQTTFFSCGGHAIGVAFSHKLGDALSTFTFVNCWAAISRGDRIRSPMFDGAAHFPPRSDLIDFDLIKWMISKEDIIIKRFLFTDTKINSLRDKYTNTLRATRVEALTAFIWTRFIVSTGKKQDVTKRIYTIEHLVNIRKRVDPPLSDDSFGNYIQRAIAELSVEDVEQYPNVIKKIREAIQSIGGKDYITKLNEEGNKVINMRMDKAKKYANGEIVAFNFSGMVRFPLSEADFGWGKPIRFSIGSSRLKNRALLIDSVCGNGIEAWISLKAEDMAMFEADQEFLAFAE